MLVRYVSFPQKTYIEMVRLKGDIIQTVYQLFDFDVLMVLLCYTLEE